jgi:hypothetical protein
MDVRRKSRIDRDLREIEIFMVEDAYEAAKEYYLYGWNTFFSLSQLVQNAFSPGPTPDFDLFNTYYEGSDYDFAHSIIMHVLEKQPPYDNASVAQRSEIVVGILRSVVMYLSTLAELDSAVDECDKTGGSMSTLELWDGGAAFLSDRLKGSFLVVSPAASFSLDLQRSSAVLLGHVSPNPNLMLRSMKASSRHSFLGAKICKPENATWSEQSSRAPSSRSLCCPKC